MVKKIFVDEAQNELEVFPTKEYKIHIGVDSDPSGEHPGCFFGYVDLSIDDALSLAEKLKEAISFLQFKMQEVQDAEK